MKEGSAQIRLLALDLDGTLLNREGKISVQNLNALQAAARQDVEIVPVSARPLFGIEFALNGFQEFRYVVAYNGSYVYDRQTGQVLFSKTMQSEDVHNLLALLKKYDFYAGYYVGNDFYADKDGEGARLEAYFLGRKPTLVPDLASISHLLPNKIIVLEPDHPERLVPFLAESQPLLANSNLYYSSHRSMEICHREVTKGSGVRHMVEMLGLNPAQVMAIGDNENDISMLEYAGLSVAMGNATSAVKDASDLVVAECEADGVAEAIEKIILAGGRQNE